MAKTFPVPAKRGTTFIVDPKDLVIDEAQNGRAFPYTQAEIYQKAASLKAQGQLQPIVVRRTDDGKVAVIAGTGRALGALYLNANDPDYATAPFLLECVVKDGQDVDAFAINVTENFIRKSLTPVDIAHNIKVSDERLGAEASDEDRMTAALALFDMKDTGDNRKWVERHRALNTLPQKLKQRIQAKALAVDAALEFVGMDPETAEAVHQAAEAQAGGKKVTKRRVQQAAATKGAAPSKRAASHALNKAQLTAFLSYQVEQNKKAAVKALCNALLGYIAGDLAEPEMVKALNKCTVANAGEK